MIKESQGKASLGCPIEEMLCSSPNNTETTLVNRSKSVGLLTELTTCLQERKYYKFYLKFFSCFRTIYTWRVFFTKISLTYSPPDLGEDKIYQKSWKNSL